MERAVRYGLAMAAMLASPAAAQDAAQHATGPVFDAFGSYAMVEDIGRAPPGAQFAVAFDVPVAAGQGSLNPAIERAAKFINMHVAHGVPEDDIRIAIVVHNMAVLDMLNEGGRSAHDLGENASASMIREMLDQGVRFIVCGQSAAGLGVRRDELIPGVEMALSAMTAHALLQQHGYTLNPF